MAKKDRRNVNSSAALANFAANQAPAQQEEQVQEEVQAESTAVQLEGAKLVAAPEILKAATPVKVVKPISMEVQRITDLLVNYKNVASNRTPNAAQKQQNTGMFYQIVQYAMSHPTTEVLETVYQFFLVENLGLMEEGRIFQALHGNAETMQKMSTFYTAFKTLIEAAQVGKKFPLSLEAIRHVLGNNNFINFLSSKLN